MNANLSPATSRRTSDAFRIWLVIIVSHLGVAALSSFFPDSGGLTFWLAVPVAVYFSQASLLGIWVGIAPVSVGVRILGWVTGVVLSFSYFCVVFDPATEGLVMTLIAITLVAGVLAVARHWKFHVVFVEEVLDQHLDGLQFQIKHLLALTLVVAILSAVVRALQPSFTSLGHVWEVIMYGIYAGTNALVCVWACFGLGSTMLRSGVGFLISLTFGWLLAKMEGGGNLFVWLFIAVLVTLIQGATLLLVRRTGIRLTRKPA